MRDKATARHCEERSDEAIQKQARHCVECNDEAIQNNKNELVNAENWIG
ncbi:MAG: hypothetical protein LBH30_03400 [Prevotellaceae bacterium]|nr:hypothetical protein [Prevotellaceae bacterium]